MQLVIFWPSGTVDPYGLCFNADVSATQDLRTPLADRRIVYETATRSEVSRFLIQVPKVGNISPRKK